MKLTALTIRWVALAILALAFGTVQAQQTGRRYDLLIKNGHVIDPKNSINEPRDVAITAGKIAAVEKNIDPALAAKVVDANGLYVTPGIIDIHVHVYAGTGGKSYTGDLSVYPDQASLLGAALAADRPTAIEVGLQAIPFPIRASRWGGTRRGVRTHAPHAHQGEEQESTYWALHRESPLRALPHPWLGG